MTDIPSLSQTEFLIMDQLINAGRKPLYGLQMVEASNGKLKRGTIYVTLARLEGKGFIQSHLEENVAGIAPPRRLYKTTGVGAQVYKAVVRFKAMTAGIGQLA